MGDLISVDPTTEAVCGRWPTDDAAGLDARLSEAAAGFLRWRTSSPAARADALLRIAASLRAIAPRAARLMAVEVGKPVAEGLAEVEKCAATLSYFATFAPPRLMTPVGDPARPDGWVRLAPLGVVLAIMPWNYPFWQVIRAAAGAWSVGDVLLVKPAPQTVGSTLLLAEAVAAAGAADLLGVVLADVEDIPSILADDRVAAVTFTGSSGVGRRVAEVAGRSLKKAVLELGGSDATVVLRGADVGRAAAIGARSRLQNNGQSCIAAKRFVVVRSEANGFVAALAAAFDAAVVGDPRDPSVTLGPLARRDLRDQLHDQVARSAAAGATVLRGGVIPVGRGWFYPPTLVTEVQPHHAVWQEETFGPVAAVRVVDDDAAAIAAANASRFGLGVSVHGPDVPSSLALVDRFHAGNVVIDGMVRSDPRFPFGGVGLSGFGRELGEIGLAELANVQAIRVG
jgi:acyl-CoA reductase-like NAD-dependent aldehyde dehydrogenase